MPIDIRPFSESTGDESSPVVNSDDRAKAFMDTLRSRIENQDEAQKQSWVKAAKPEPKRKPVTPGNPDWMNVAKKPAKDTPQSASKPQSRPFGSPKKKSSKQA